MECARLTLMLVLTAVPCATAQSNIDPAQKLAWCENIGWTNWRDAGEGAEGVRVSLQFLAGFVWSENTGWINVGDGSPGADCGGRACYSNIDASDFGVNVDENGLLRGLAWGENIGWINFDLTLAEEERASFDFCAQRLVGFAWGENVGWINLNDTNSYVGVGPCRFADADCDGNIGSDDFSVLLPLFRGPDVTVDCPLFDSDEDSDIDLLDFAGLQNVFSN